MKMIAPKGINGRIACQLCGSERLRVLSTIGSFTAVQCRTCALVWAEPLPTLEELRKLYETGEIIEDSGTEEFDESGHVIVPFWKEAEVATMLELLNRHQPNRGRLLDVGCLWGIFLTRATAAGWEAEGFEPWSKAANYCREVEGLQVRSGILEEVDYGPGKFDAITLFDVI